MTRTHTNTLIFISSAAKYLQEEGGLSNHELTFCQISQAR